jgi:hypothetical protein
MIAPAMDPAAQRYATVEMLSAYQATVFATHHSRQDEVVRKKEGIEKNPIPSDSRLAADAALRRPARRDADRFYAATH